MSDLKKRPNRLGRGLTALMASPVAVTPATGAVASEPASDSPTAAAAVHPVTERPEPSAADTPPAATDGLRYVALDDIQPNRHQPRQRFDPATLASLAESLRRDGLMQPVVLRPSGLAQPPYELVAGERRWRAARLAGLEAIPALVRELDDQQLAELALIENIQREDLNPIDRAEAFQRLSDRFGMSHDAIAARVGFERSTISNLLRLLSLTEPVKQLVRDDLLSMGQARAIAGLSDAAAQHELAKRAVRDGLSVREVEAAVRKTLAAEPVAPTAASPSPRESQLADLERQIAEQLGTKVAIQAGRKKGAGKLTIEFYSLEQFDALVERMNLQLD